MKTLSVSILFFLGIATTCLALTPSKSEIKLDKYIIDNSGINQNGQKIQAEGYDLSEFYEVIPTYSMGHKNLKEANFWFKSSSILKTVAAPSFLYLSAKWASDPSSFERNAGTAPCIVLGLLVMSLVIDDYGVGNNLKVAIEKRNEEISSANKIEVKSSVTGYALTRSFMNQPAYYGGVLGVAGMGWELSNKPAYLGGIYLIALGLNSSKASPMGYLTVLGLSLYNFTAQGRAQSEVFCINAAGMGLVYWLETQKKKEAPQGVVNSVERIQISPLWHPRTDTKGVLVSVDF